jgi:DNA-binding NtrC family response regulator
MTATGRILIVDDEKVVRDSLAGWLREDGHVCETASSGELAIQAIRHAAFDLCVVDLKMPRGIDGLETMRKIQEIRPDCSVVIITAYATVGTAVDAMKHGAEDYLVKPFEPRDLSAIAERVVALRRVRRPEKGGSASVEVSRFHGMVTRNPAMLTVFDMIRNIADLRSTVLIEGESGTGKELVARAIHENGRRREGPYIQLSCAALPETLLESELFGYERGAFTGAVSRKRGKFEVAGGGTLLLDEIGDVGPKVQTDLLRVLQERRIVRLGGSEEIAVDVRFVAATNRPLRAAVQEGRFREDLFYRLNVIHVEIPPLRKRLEDLDLLVFDLLQQASKEVGRTVKEVAPAAIERLSTYAWPGNVRELENAVERALVGCRGDRLEPGDFDFLFRTGAELLSWLAPSHLSLKEVEARVVESVLRSSGWNVSEAAATLGIDRSTLYDKMRRHGIERPDEGGEQETSR